MSGHLGKILLMVVMTHGFRAMSRLWSPKWAGLALGLPCSTAVALIGCGSDRGVDDAVAMSSNSLLGLAGAVALPMAYAQAVLRGWKLPWAMLYSVATYLLVAVSASRILPGDGLTNLGVAIIAVCVAMTLASRIKIAHRPNLNQESGRFGGHAKLLRTLVPILCLFSSLLLGEFLGPEVAGLMSTFPGMTLTVLLLTHLETGSGSALRMARALPVGNLGMVAFLAAFRFGCPSFGLLWGSILGYASAFVVLILVILFQRVPEEGRDAVFSRNRTHSQQDFARMGWPRKHRQFSPLLEPIRS